MVLELLGFAVAVEWAHDGSGGLGAILGGAGNTHRLKAGSLRGPCQLPPQALSLGLT